MKIGEFISTLTLKPNEEKIITFHFICDDGADQEVGMIVLNYDKMKNGIDPIRILDGMGFLQMKIFSWKSNTEGVDIYLKDIWY